MNKKEASLILSLKYVVLSVPVVIVVVVVVVTYLLHCLASSLMLYALLDWLPTLPHTYISFLSCSMNTHTPASTHPHNLKAYPGVNSTGRNQTKQ